MVVAVVVAAKYVYSPNPDQPNVFMSVALDLPDVESPVSPLVSLWWWWWWWWFWWW